MDFRRPRTTPTHVESLNFSKETCELQIGSSSNANDGKERAVQCSGIARTEQMIRPDGKSRARDKRAQLRDTMMTKSMFSTSVMISMWNRGSYVVRHTYFSHGS